MSAHGNGGPDMARLAAMSRRALDLGAMRGLPPELDEKVRAQAEQQLGMRCAGCGERIGVGFKFTRIDIVLVEDKPTVDVAYLSACNGAQGCDFAERAKDGADAMELIEFAWLSGAPPVPGGVVAGEDAPRDPGVVGDPG